MTTRRYNVNGSDAIDPGRRRFIKSTAAVAATGATTAITGFPYISTSHAAARNRPLKFWQFYAPGGQVAAQSQWFQRMVSNWNDSHDQKIELEFVPVGQYINGSQLLTAFASGSGPDLFLISPGDFLRYYNGGVLLDLTPYIGERAQKDFPEHVMSTRVVDERIHAIPMEVEPMAMYYSLQAFEEAGLSEADVPGTWEELLDVAERLTTKDRYGVIFETEPGYYQNFTWYPFLWQGHGEIQNDSGGSGFNSEASIQALNFWQQSIQRGVAPRSLLGNGGPDPVANLASGYGAMQNCGIWGLAALDQNAPDFPYGVFRLPVPEGGDYVTVGGGWAFCANAKGINPDAAGEFCAWAIASMSDASIERVARWCTEAKSDMPPRKSVFRFAEEDLSSGLLGKFTREIYPGARGEPRVPPTVYKIISDAIQAAQLGGQDPAQQAAIASQRIDSFLASYNGASIR